MWRPNTSFFIMVAVMDGIIFSVNASLGVFGFLHHRGHFIWIVNFGCAIAIAISLVKLRRSLGRRDAALRVQWDVIRGRYPVGAYETAMENLKQVAKVTGAKIDPAACRAELKIGGREYSIVAGNIYRNNPLGHATTACLQYQKADMPEPEMIAATLLLLHNDPKLFDHWCAQDGWHA